MLVQAMGVPRQRISLHNLAASNHPTMEDGSFSIWNDPLMRTATMTTHYVDLDGVVVTSRSLAAFNVCPCGEARIVTNSEVREQRPYVQKNAIFEEGSYDAAHLRLSKFMPGFRLVELPGGNSLCAGGLEPQGLPGGSREMER